MLDELILRVSFIEKLNCKVAARCVTALPTLFCNVGVARIMPLAALAAGELSLIPCRRSLTHFSFEITSPYWIRSEYASQWIVT